MYYGEEDILFENVILFSATQFDCVMPSKKLVVPHYKPGDIVEVKVTHIINYGAFCEVPFTDPETGEEIKAKGLLHISEIFDFFVKNIEEFFCVGDFIEVEVLNYEPKTHQWKLSYKSIRPALLRSKEEPQKRKTVIKKR